MSNRDDPDHTRLGGTRPSDTGPTGPMFPGYSEVEFKASGGFGRVYRAKQDGLGRWVAIKTLIDADAEGVAAFAEEARRLASLNVAGVIQVYDFQSAGPGGMPYLVTEWVDSGTLEGRRGLDEAQIRTVGHQVALILAEVHAAGILHRDIKPANIFVSSDGKMKVGDFGIARAYTGRTSTSAPSSQMRAATVAFAPWELLMGHRRTERSDVYSLAATMYALAVGSPPYLEGAEPSVSSIMARHLNDPVPHLRDRGWPGPLADVVFWGMQKDPNLRPPSARAFADALAGTAAVRTDFPSPVTAAPPGPTPVAPAASTNRGLLVALAALVAILGVTVVALALRDNGDDNAPTAAGTGEVSDDFSGDGTAPPGPGDIDGTSDGGSSSPDNGSSPISDDPAATAPPETVPAKPVDLAEQVNPIEGECWPPDHSVGVTFRGIEGEWWNCDLGERYSSVGDMRLRVVLGSRFSALTLTFWRM